MSYVLSPLPKQGEIVTDADPEPPLQTSGLPVVDLQKAGTIDGVADNFLPDMFRGFHDHYENSAATIREFLDAGNFKEAQVLAHSIVGISGSLGAERVCATATNLDRALVQGLDASVVDAAWVDYDVAIDELIAFIDDRYPTHPEV
jgi:HPt (histidine-containing phosphotransfer) domain-containing protein